MTDVGTTGEAEGGEVVRLVPPVEDHGTPATDTLRLRRTEPLAIGLQRMALEQLDIAQRGLAGSTAHTDWDRGIHSARKAMKRTRALLRLVRDHLGYPVYRDENVVLRDQARRLSNVRAAKVLAGTLDLLTPKDLGGVPPSVVEAVRSELIARHRTQAHAVRADIDGLAAAKMAIGCARIRVAAWPVLDIHAEPGAGSGSRLQEGFASLEPGILRVYRRGRRAMRAARTERTALAFHEWRKRVKYLRYQIEALQDCWPPVMEGLEISLNSLAETLGDEHDLADLCRLVSADPAFVPDPKHRALLLAGIDRRRRKLQDRALDLGARIYAEDPKRFTMRLRAYWEVWRPSFT